MSEILRCAESMLAYVKNWKPIVDNKLPPTAHAFEGDFGVWRFVVIRFERLNDIDEKIEDGYDGTITRSEPGILVMRMPREMAERVGKIAEKAIRAVDPAAVIKWVK